MNSFEWLHFSDLHISYQDPNAQKAKDKLIEFIKKQRRQGKLKYNYIFISGDIANKSKYDRVEDYFIKFISALGLNNSTKDLKKVFWAVGNHDILREPEEERHQIIKEIRDRKKKLTLSDCLDIPKNGVKQVILIDHGMKLFYKKHLELLKRDYTTQMDKMHVFQELPDLNLIILNTCLTSVDESDTHNLHIKSFQLREIFEEIKDKEKPIFVLGHHGRDFFCMEDMDELSDVFDEFNVDVYLCGHNHRLGFAMFPDTSRDIYQLTCGGGAGLEGASFSFMHGKFNGDDRTIQITPYSYNYSGDQVWGVDNRLSKRLKSDTSFVLDRLVKNRFGLDLLQEISDEISIVSMERKDSSDYVNILHLSDLQFGITTDTSGKQEVAIKEREVVLEKKLLDYLRTNIPEKWMPNIIVASGDLAWSAEKEDYKKFSIWLKKLVKIINIPLENVILCTGNHDISSNAAMNNTKRIITSELAHRELYEGAGKEDIYENFSEFISFCKGEVDSEVHITPLNNILSDESGGRYLYGFRDILDIRFNVLNTSWYCRDNKKKENSVPDKNNLWIGEGFVQDLQHNLLDNDKFSVTVLHHPFDWLNPEEGDDNADVKKCILKLSDVILCGHVHTPVGEPTFEHNRTQIFQSGALWDKTKYVYESRIIRINKRTGAINQLTLEYDVHEKEWKHRIRKGPNKDRSYPINYTEHPDSMFNKL